MSRPIRLYPALDSTTTSADKTNIASPPFYRSYLQNPVIPPEDPEAQPEVLNGSDLQLVYSGGAFNNDPDSSIGGEPSSFPVPNGTLNNLFDNVTKTQAETGNTDYRCIYFFNNSETASLYNPLFQLVDPSNKGATAFMGFEIATEVQRVSIYGTVSGGSVTLAYDDTTFEFAYSSSGETWSNNLQTAIREIDLLDNVVVTFNKNPVAPSGSGAQNILNITFELKFAGLADYRRHPIMSLSTNDLTGDNRIEISRVIAGGPINAIAQQLDSELSGPLGVDFSFSNQTLPRIRPGDGVPIWFKRTNEADTSPVYQDNCTLRILGNPLPVQE